MTSTPAAVVHAAQQLHAAASSLPIDWIPAGVVAVVLLALAIALVTVSRHHSRDAD